MFYATEAENELESNREIKFSIDQSFSIWAKSVKSGSQTDGQTSTN